MGPHWTADGRKLNSEKENNLQTDKTREDRHENFAGGL